MNNEIATRVAHVMNFVYTQWPQIMPYISDDHMLFDHGFGRGTGLCSNPELIDDEWITSYGSKSFTETNLPEGFQCIGIQNRGGSEYVFIMWFKNGRKFWFYDQYVVLVGEGFPASKERTSKRIDKALEHWETTDHDVLYSGIDDQFS